MNHPAIRSGAVAVITGAAVGIGYAIARRVASEGMNVVLFDRDASALDVAIKTLRNQFPDVNLLLIKGDVTSESDLHHLYERSCEFGEVSLLVNNAAINTGARPWEGLAQWRTLMEINFWSVLTLQQLFVDTMFSQSGAAAIVNLGSKEGITTRPGNAAYSLSKAAVKVLTEQLAHELREKVGDRVTAHLLIPGYTFTPMNFPGMTRDTKKPDSPWTADQVADRMVEKMAEGDFYIFCEDNEASWELHQCRMQWAADDMIQNRPALSRWHEDYADEFTDYIADIVHK
ncbi:SDR family NAD(P)-dependent oxidoreductase [Pseudomonas sp. TNT2022 ID642]|uniref:SDR family NAD(P)-dependent oxidoreductase n=1 Tax=Pseudomonas sp. TNT2022 ID642 TaxID=2942632 RepID=UPI0023621C19|nr:SDR family oxidoreductase [Pseudomonas sp. TNT2022 ID642]MDD1001687.1 SDR family oxidoreductase [Pseudomonas sp. TNT2022 ID642]